MQAQKGLLVPARAVTIGSVPINNSLSEFASRLNALCDEKNIPPKGKARQTTVATLFEVSQKGARKWLEGEGYPTLEKAKEIATWGNVQVEWLLTGRGGKQLTAADPAANALTAQEPTTSRHHHVTALIAAVERLDPDDARNLLPVVARIANSAPRSTAKPNSTNAIINLTDDDANPVAAAQ